MKVFLSYNHPDRSRARALANGLNQEGFDVWSDEFIQPGDSIASVIGSAIDDADAFVVLVGKEAARSQWSLLELGGAIASGIPVTVDRDAESPILLRDRRFVTFESDSDEQSTVREVSEALRSGTAHRGDLRRGTEIVDEGYRVLRGTRHAYEVEFARQRAHQARLQLGLLAGDASE